MKHRIGNNPQCYSCLYFRERESDLLPCRCINLAAQEVNGRRVSNPREFMVTEDNDSACRHYIECETGFTRFEIVTGKDEVDLHPIDFNNEIRLHRIV